MIHAGTAGTGTANTCASYYLGAALVYTVGVVRVYDAIILHRY